MFRKQTLLSAITKQTENYVSTSDIEKQITNAENYKAIELKQVIDGTNYVFFEFPTRSDYENCIEKEDLSFDAVLLVVDGTAGVPEDEIQDALNVTNFIF